MDDFTTEGKRSLSVAQRRIDKHLMPFFGGRRLASITRDDVTRYVAHRQKQGIERTQDGEDGHPKTVRVSDVSNAEINRELQHLKRIFSLAIQGGRIGQRPHIPRLREDKRPHRVFEQEQMASVLRHLDESLRPLMQVGCITGWRVQSELLPLEWRQVDFAGGEIRLDRGTTKNGEGRVFPMTAALRQMLTAQQKAHRKLKEAGHIVPYVFWRMVAEGRGGPKKPQPIVRFDKAWKLACRAAGCPGRIPHDMRRTAVRNLVRAGVPQTVAMKMTGHKTDSVFRRYDIVSPGDLRDAAARLDAVGGA